MLDGRDVVFGEGAVALVATVQGIAVSPPPGGVSGLTEGGVHRWTAPSNK